MGHGQGSLSRAAGSANFAGSFLRINTMVSVADSNTEWVRGECCLTGHLLDMVAVVVEMVFEKQHAIWRPLVRGWRKWGSATGGCLPKCWSPRLGNLEASSFLSVGGTGNTPTLRAPDKHPCSAT